jgi:hypothetical protein
VGELISNLRAESAEKNKNLKTFNLMARCNPLPYEL